MNNVMGNKHTVLALAALLLSISATAQKNMPGAGSSSTSSTPQSTAPDFEKLPKLGDYVELDDSLKNEMYGTVDFANAELKDIIKAISKLANKNFILDRKIENRKVTIISPQPVTKQEAYNAFLSALYMNDLTIVSMGKFLKIVETKAALQSNIRVFMGDSAPASEEVVTVLYPLKHLNAEDIQRFLTDLVPRNGRIASYPNTNTLVMTDTGLNLRRIVEILKSIDVSGHDDQLESILIRYANAKQLSSLIDTILDAQGGRRGTNRSSNNRSSPQKTRGGGIITKIVPDERTNSLVVLANGRGIQELKALISKLDTPDAAGGGNIHIYYAKNAVAEKLSATIDALINNSKKPGSANAPGATPGVPRPNVGDSGGGGGDDGLKFEGNVKVQADAPTNSLVVIASGSDFAALKTILRKLDIPRRQVYVEATIMEIAINDKRELGVGINYAQPGLPQAGGFIPSAGLTKADLLSAASTPAGINGLLAGFTAGKKVNVSIGGASTTISTVTGLIKALQDTKQANILHQPQIIASDNEKSEIKVVNKVPVVSGTTTVSGSTNLSTSISKEDVTIKLTITPQIGRDNDLVRLQVEQQMDDFVKVTVGGGENIETTQRSATTQAVVRDGDTIVIGGLQKNLSSDNRSKFPILGDLPIVGLLFRGSFSEITKSNLILFLTPKIINSYSDLLRNTSDQIRERDKLSSNLYDPRDRFRENVKEFRSKNDNDRKKPEPRGWGFAPKDLNKDFDDEEDEFKPRSRSQETKQDDGSPSAYMPGMEPAKQPEPLTIRDSANTSSAPPPLLNTPVPEASDMSFGQFGDAPAVEGQPKAR
jgi:general secretion pathway protein D